MKVEGNKPGPRAVVRVLGMFAIIGFTSYLPQLWWEVSWQDLFYIAGNSSKEIQIANTLSKVLQGLGITENNLHSWAVERIFICIAIAIGLSILLFFITKNIGRKIYIIKEEDTDKKA